MNLTSTEITSHSRLGVYEKCGKMYEFEYVKKIRKRVEADHFIIGDFCHKSLEAYYKAEAETPIEALTARWDDWLTRNGLTPLVARLKDYSHDISHLYRRASADYNGADRIRKKGDLVADAPHMTGAWKQAVRDLDLEARQTDIDWTALQALGPAYATVSLSNCYGQTYNILTGYRDPECITSVEYIEFPLSHRVFDPVTRAVTDVWNPIKLPSTGKLFNAYIDMVVRMIPELGSGIGLFDHKTSNGAPPSIIEVAHHDQLLKYAWSWHQLTGEWPTHIGVNHLRSKTCVVAPLEPELAIEAVERMESLVRAEQAAVYLKRDAFGYGSPCLKMRDGSLESHCPHLTRCHAKVAERFGIQHDGLS